METIQERLDKLDKEIDELYIRARKSFDKYYELMKDRMADKPKD